MNQLEMNLNVIAGRDWGVGDEKTEDIIFYPPFKSEENLEPHPNAECNSGAGCVPLRDGAPRPSIYMKPI
jgi:hypothetical protein